MSGEKRPVLVPVAGVAAGSVATTAAVFLAFAYPLGALVAAVVGLASVFGTVDRCRCGEPGFELLARRANRAAALYGEAPARRRAPRPRRPAPIGAPRRGRSGHGRR